MRRLVILAAACALLAGPAATHSAIAVEDAAQRVYSVCVGPAPHSPLESSVCRAQSDTGETVEVNGAGIFNPAADTSGAGTYVIRDGSGLPIAQGAWHSAFLISFESWGTHVRTGHPLPPVTVDTFLAEGGVVKMYIVLRPLPDSPLSPAVAILTIRCTIGDVPANTVEGIEFNILGGLNFNHSHLGATGFFKSPVTA